MSIPSLAIGKSSTDKERATFRRLIELAMPIKGWLLLSVLLGALTVGTGVGLTAMSAYLIAQGAMHPSVAALTVPIFGVRIFGLLRGVFRYLERYVSHYAALSLLSRLRVWFYEGVEPLAPAGLIGRRGGDLLSLVVADLNTLQDFYVRVLAPPLVAGIIGVVLWFLLGAYDPIFALIWLLFYVLAAVGVPLLTHLLSRKAGEQMVAARGELNAQIVDGIGGVAELVAFGQEERYERRLAQLNQKLIGLQTYLTGVGGSGGALTSLTMNGAMWAILVVAAPQVSSGRLEGVYLAMLVLATLASFEAIMPLAQAAQGLGASKEAARRLFEVVDSRPQVADTATKSPMPVGATLIVQDLTFRYKPDEPAVLQSVALTLQPGRLIALVGASGAGKSTIVNLLMRFWDYEAGRITISGHDLREYRSDDARALFSVVAQGTHLFNTTIRANLLLARPDATEEQLLRAAEQARILDFIKSLPAGFDTRLGEDGMRLSGGERQRIALARAFLHDAPILLLDEPTSNLDTVTEREVLQTIRELASEKAVLLITHRLTGLEVADEIVVLRGGRVVERGKHNELLQMEGSYFALWQAQNEALQSV